MQEEALAGLYLLRNAVATQVNPSGPDVQADYAFSPDGSRFAFSSADQSGGSRSGIFMATVAQPTSFTQLWDHGNHPRFIPGEQLLVCAGPEDGSELQGIWQIDLQTRGRSRIAPLGLSPEIAPDGLKISYLIEGNSYGRRLVVLDRTNGRIDTLTGATSVLHYTWLGTSDALIMESDSVTTPKLFISYLGRLQPPEFLVFGLYPAGFTAGRSFVYTGYSGDRNDGLFITAPDGEPARISSTGTLAMPASENRIVAQDSSGLLLITR
jgi:hypothetical protein